MVQEQFNDLLEKWLSQQISEKEFADFRAALNHPEHAQWLAGALDNDLLTGKFEGLTNDRQRKAAFELLMKQAEIDESVIKPAHRVHLLRTAWFKSAAAVIILITGIAIYFFIHTSQSKVEVAQTTPSPLPKQDVLPGSDRAILTLSNGQQVQLNNATSETIKDGTLSIENNNGQLTYAENGKLLSPFEKGGRRDSQNGGTAGGFNTMQTPKGGQYKLTLSDGTKVWLNAASSITYPIAFTAKTRTVSITGEAYFEVTKNPKQPFIVKTSKEEITVLGTSFNVNSYENEPVSKTSLMEGSVRISAERGPVSPAGAGKTGGGSREARTAVRQGVTLTPGQAYTNGKVTQTNIEQDLAWKNGIFNFSNQDFAASMRQLERWYDIKVIYDGEIPKGKFSGEISRSLNLSDAIELLNGVVARFKLQDRELHVLK